MRARPTGLPIALLAVATFALGAWPARAQDPPPCATSAGAAIDATSPIAYRRTGTITVFAATPEAQNGTFSVVAKDPSRPISHPASMPYSALPRDEDGQGRFRLRAEPGDGDAVAALTWTASEGGTACRARVSVTIRIGRGRLPFVDVNHEGTRSVFFGVERPECFNMRIVPLVVEVSGRGGRVRQRTSDVCTRRFRRTGSNRHFSLTARGGVVAFRARRPRGVYRARYRVLVNGRVVVRGGLRVRLFRGRVKVGITVRRR